MKSVLSLLASTLIAMTAFSLRAQETINLWPNGTPDDNGADNTATLTIYPAAEGTTPTGQAVVICPGGAYEFLATDHEGHDVARHFASHGIAAAVLKYRLPNGHHTIPAEDAREAIKIVRSKASELGVDPKKVGVIGFSAGGHLASTVSTHPAAAEEFPSFSILIYPVISSDPAITHRGSINNLLGKDVNDPLMLASYSNDLRVTPSTPPTLLILSGDDTTVPAENSLRYYSALARCKVPAEMHLFTAGEHGWGIKPSFERHEDFKKLLIEWLSRL